ncbi:VWA domain-containing protein [Natrinema salsiterrestre]|uniref:VWA domain-containing protein n=1 Tax=Natrinema salsiterrestre TaxID=2950540 RepID=A0A9Q4Q575_9EURY|nr:VWA domain-containing protein [Natrinema salsiterrestre]MDF9748292.1 VWA domain-containing protein [Natrinema salsiterrestre]
MSDRGDDAGADVHDHVRTELVRFVRELRRSGAAVPANAGTTAARSIAEIGLEDRSRVRTALRASLLTDSGDFEVFDRLFEIFWRRLTAGSQDGRPSAPIDDGLEPALDSPDAPDPDDNGENASGDPEDGDRVTGRSLAESFAAAVSDAAEVGGSGAATALYSPSGSAETVDGRLPTDSSGLATPFRDLTRALGQLQGRRFQSGTDRADIRRALRASVSTGGTVLSVPKRDRRRTAVRAVLLVDVSRSVLDTVDRGFLIEFLRRARRDWRDARVFFFDEALREVTDSLDAESATTAFEALEAAEAAWGGGTRIGRSFEQLRETAPETVDRRTVVFVVSDGLERGDIDVLERGLSWIDRRAERVLWLNPLATAPSYEPTARGMATAVPYLDGLFPFAGPDDVAELARQLRQHGASRRIGYEFDARSNRQTTTRTTNQP